MVFVFIDIVGSSELKRREGTDVALQKIRDRLYQIEREFMSLDKEVVRVDRPGDAILLAAPSSLAVNFLRMSMKIQASWKHWDVNELAVRIMLEVGEGRWIGEPFKPGSEISGVVVDIVAGRLQNVCPVGGVVFGEGMWLALREYPGKWKKQFKEREQYFKGVGIQKFWVSDLNSDFSGDDMSLSPKHEYMNGRKGLSWDTLTKSFIFALMIFIAAGIWIGNVKNNAHHDLIVDVLLCSQNKECAKSFEQLSYTHIAKLRRKMLETAP